MKSLRLGLLSAVFCPFSLSLWYETSLKAELVKRRISIKSNAESAFWWHFCYLAILTWCLSSQGYFFSSQKGIFLQSAQTNTAFQEANKLRLGNLWYIIMQSWTATAADKGRKKTLNALWNFRYSAWSVETSAAHLLEKSSQYQRKIWMLKQRKAHQTFTVKFP